MAFTNAGLTNGGITTHYQFQYDDSLAPGGLEPARTNAVITACENDFNMMKMWFGNISLNVNLPIAVNVTQNQGGAKMDFSLNFPFTNWSAVATINPGVRAASYVRYLLVAEIVELFMLIQGNILFAEYERHGWFGSSNEGSEGEGLSRFLAAQFWALNGFGNPPDGSTSNDWLSSSRADFVNRNFPDNKPDPTTGCALLFIYYLFNQLGFSIEAIVGAAASTLSGVYKNLTRDSGDPFPVFKGLLDTAFPGTAVITQGNLDNPFPLPSTAKLSTLQYLRKDAPGTKSLRDVIGSRYIGNLRAVLNSDRTVSLV